MAYQPVARGSSDDDGAGDTLRAGAAKINANFVELYTALGTGSAITSGISADSSIITLTTPVIAKIDSGSTITLDATTDIILDADGGDIFFKDAGTTFGSANNSSGDLVVKSGTTTALTFSGANVTAAGTIASGAITSSGVVTATGFTIGSAVIVESELEQIDGLAAGTVTASKAVVVDSNKDIGTFRNLTISGVFTDGNYTFDDSGNVSGLGTLGSGAITSSGSITSGSSFIIGSADINETDLEKLDGITNGTAAANKAVVADGSTAVSGLTLTAPTIVEIDSGSTLTLDATTDIVLDAAGGDIFFKEDGTTFGSATNTSGDLIVKSGTTTALTFSGANVTAAGTIASGAITTSSTIAMAVVADPSTVANYAHIYAKDESSSAEVYVRDEAGNVTKISPHNDQGEWEYFSKNIKTGKTVRVNMEEMIKDIEKLTGKSYIKDE
ncbi:hypothetical protein CMI47_08250 [Candidatus Pacearchaeota archaeon]|nr:hypothetical protein [Candidatus Pacearchaeota archaeon]|tara:strand:+ start:2305 stop:3633 length:1329 start_codon:yes stop_codon:yes gene_type:complete